MSMLKFQWRDGARFSVGADIVGAAIEDVAAKVDRPFGGVEAGDVVDAARDAASPLHPLFCWDDAEAAEQYRRTQAGAIIRSLRVVRVGVADDTPRRFMVSVATDSADDEADDDGFVGPATKRPFVALATVTRVDALRARAIGDAVKLLNGCRARVAEIEGTEAAIRYIDAAVTAVRAAATPATNARKRSRHDHAQGTPDPVQR